MSENNGHERPGGVPRLALRPAEAAAAIGVSKRKLWELTADRTSGIPVVRLGKAVVYPVAELSAWLGSRVTNRRPKPNGFDTGQNAG